jgi:hypothetical protein
VNAKTMPRDLRSFLAPLAALMGLAVPIAPARAQDHIYVLVECDGGLQDAKGVIGPKHGYEITGECVLWRMRRPDDTDEMEALLDDGETAWHDKALVKIKTRAEASWDRKSGSTKESVTLEGPVTGKVAASGTCTKDPFLGNVPCSGMSIAASLVAGPHLTELLTALEKRGSFLFRNRVALGEAQALSAQQSTTTVPPPPEPRNPPLVDHVVADYIMIGRSEHIVRVTLRGAQPITASLSRGRGTPRPIVLDDPGPGPSKRTAALRIPPAAVQTPGVLTIALGNKHGNARVELLACAYGGAGNPKGCPVRVKAGTTPPPTVAEPIAPVVPPGGRTR